MLTELQTTAVSEKVKSIQAVSIAALMGSIGLFVVIASMANWEKAHTGIPMLVLIAAVSGFSMYVISFLFYGFFVGSTRTEQRDDEGGSSAAGVIMTSHVLRLALIEGACFLNAIVFLLESGLVNFAVALFGIVLMVVLYPTRQKILDTASGLLK